MEIHMQIVGCPHIDYVRKPTGKSPNNDMSTVWNLTCSRHVITEYSHEDVIHYVKKIIALNVLSGTPHVPPKTYHQFYTSQKNINIVQHSMNIFPGAREYKSVPLIIN